MRRGPGSCPSQRSVRHRQGEGVALAVLEPGGLLPVGRGDHTVDGRPHFAKVEMLECHAVGPQIGDDLIEVLQTESGCGRLTCSEMKRKQDNRQERRRPPQQFEWPLPGVEQPVLAPVHAVCT